MIPAIGQDVWEFGFRKEAKPDHRATQRFHNGGQIIGHRIGRTKAENKRAELDIDKAGLPFKRVESPGVLKLGPNPFECSEKSRLEALISGVRWVAMQRLAVRFLQSDNTARAREPRRFLQEAL